MPVQPFNNRDELNDLSDLNFHVIENIAANFIKQHGLRSVHNGELQSHGAEDSMAVELHTMLSQPLLGLRQIIPLISFWIDEFSLKFDDKLYEIEQRRLMDFQNLADQLETMIAEQEKISIKLKLADFLAELQYDEIHEAIPILEQHFDLHNQPNNIQMLHTPPQTPKESLVRLKNLLQFSEHEIDLTIQPGAKQDGNTVDTSLMAFGNDSGSDSSDSQNIENQAEQWLEKFKVDGVKFERFVEAYYDEPEKMQSAIDQAIITKPALFLSTEQHPKRRSLLEKIIQKLSRK